jgi:hypothetical protein
VLRARRQPRLLGNVPPEPPLFPGCTSATAPNAASAHAMTSVRAHQKRHHRSM